MGPTFKETQPWVFFQTAPDGDYWQKHGVQPAQLFLAMGGAGKAMSK